MDVVVRRAGTADAEGIARVHTLGWQQGYAGLLPAEFLAQRVVSAQSWDTWLAQPLVRSAAFVAVADVQVVGFALVGPAEDAPDPTRTADGELRALYVLSDWWGAGVGYRLHHAGLGALVDLGYRAGQLTVLASNTRTIVFYQRQGWVEDAPESDLDVGGLVARVKRFRHDLGLGAGPLDVTGRALDSGRAGERASRRRG